VQRFSKRTVLLFGLPVAFVVYLSTACYCTVSIYDKPIKVVSKSRGCTVVDVPEPWVLADGQQVFGTMQSQQNTVGDNGDVVHYDHYFFNQYEVRRSRTDPNMLFVALRNSESEGEAPVSLTSKNKFKFRWPYAGDRSTILDLQRATAGEWENARLLAENTRNVNPPKPWYGTGSYLESKAGRYVELSRSKGGGYQGHGILDLNGLFWDLIYNPPTWTWFTIFSAAERKQIGAATVRTCDTSLLQLAAWHGESIFSIPLSNNQRNILLCHTGEPPEPETAGTSVMSDSVTAAKPGPVARILSLSETQLDKDHNGRVDLILINAAVDVTIAGSYQILVTLKAANGKESEEQTTMLLQPGFQKMWVHFPTAEIKYLTADGPYHRKARLIYEGTGFVTSSLDAGPSFPYKLHDLDGPDPEYR
jgi:hypothetical protein